MRKNLKCQPKENKIEYLFKLQIFQINNIYILYQILKMHENNDKIIQNFIKHNISQDLF